MWSMGGQCYSPLEIQRGIIEERKSDLFTEIDSLSSELSMMYDQQIKKEMPKVWLIHGKNNITAKSLDMVSKAKKSVMMLGDLYFPEEVESLKPIILKAKEKQLVSNHSRRYYKDQ